MALSLSFLLSEGQVVTGIFSRSCGSGSGSGCCGLHILDNAFGALLGTAKAECGCDAEDNEEGGERPCGLLNYVGCLAHAHNLVGRSEVGGETTTLGLLNQDDESEEHGCDDGDRKSTRLNSSHRL